jgi:hypothetical protein
MKYIYRFLNTGDLFSRDRTIGWTATATSTLSGEKPEQEYSLEMLDYVGVGSFSHVQLEARIERDSHFFYPT